jgi:hypothetical protein
MMKLSDCRSIAHSKYSRVACRNVTGTAALGRSRRALKIEIHFINSNLFVFSERPPNVSVEHAMAVAARGTTVPLGDEEA